MSAKAVSERKQQLVEEQAAALLEQMDASTRLQLKLDKRKARSVGLLKRGPTIEMLNKHPLIQKFKLDSGGVYGVMERILGEKPVQKQHRTSAPREVTKDVRKCTMCFSENIGVDQRRGVAFFGCMSCGVEFGPCIDYGNPYRDFTREDGTIDSRTHWSISDEGKHRPEDHHYVDMMIGALQYSAATADLAREKLREFPRVGTALNAAAAAIILCLMQYNQDEGILRDPLPPQMFGTCQECGAKCDSKKAARFHCHRKR